MFVGGTQVFVGRCVGQENLIEHYLVATAVTALSGSGPAYVFYLIEAMVSAAEQMGLSDVQGRLPAQATVALASIQRR